MGVIDGKVERKRNEIQEERTDIREMECKRLVRESRGIKIEIEKSNQTNRDG